MTGLIFLSKSSLQVYDDKTKKIFQLNFKPDVVRDLEVINAEQLSQQIKSFVASGRITPSPLIMIVSHNMFFEKDLPALTKEQQQVENQKFLDNIPFEDIASKAFVSDKGYTIIATNGYLIEKIREEFEALGFAINISLPAILFGNIGDGLNPAITKIILGKYPQLKQYNLLSLKEISQEHEQEKKEEKSEKEEKSDSNVNDNTKKKNIIAIAIFAALIIILGVIVFVVTSMQNAELTQNTNASTQESTNEFQPKPAP